MKNIKKITKEKHSKELHNMSVSNSWAALEHTVYDKMKQSGLDELQKDVWNNKIKRGWDKTDNNTELLLTYGELNEAFKAKTKEEFRLEIADVGIYLLGIAEKNGFSLFEAMKEKHEYNLKRELGYEKG